MSKNILIVENDAALSNAMKDKLVARGFEVAQTSDGKGCAELIRRTKPNLVVLAVDLAAGQNGYIICKKLKSDDELKPIPVIIVGNPDGFGQHKKLKTHADDYLGKPFDPSAVIDRIGNLIGLPELAPVDDGSMNLNELMDEKGPEEIALDPPEETVGNGDPDFEMVDQMFDDKTSIQLNPTSVQEEIKSAEFQVDEDIAAPVEAEKPIERTVIGMRPSSPPPAPPPSASPPPAPRPSASDATDMRALKSRVTELTGSLDDSKARAAELEEKVRELEAQLETKQTEVDAAKSTGGKTDNKDLFALKDQVNKKDKEILRLKNELNEKEKEVVDLHEKETALEQAASETSDEVAKRDAQIKTLTTKSDQLAAERKKVDQQLTTAKEEARASAAQLTTLQSDFDTMQARNDSMETELGMLKVTSSEADTARQEAEGKLSELRGEHDALKATSDEREKEVEEVRGQLELAKTDLESANTQLGSQATTFAEEMSGLRKKLNDLEASAAKNDSRAKALFARIKTEESLRERTRVSMQQALAALEEQPESVDELMNDDEIAEA